MKGDSKTIAGHWHEETDIPLVITLRTRKEGGQFSGNGEDWWEIVGPLLPFASYVDIEQEFSAFAPLVTKERRTVIGSYHTPSMPSLTRLYEIAKDLRSFGDIPKIVVSPGNYDQVLEFLAFTHHAEKPVITS